MQTAIFVLVGIGLFAVLFVLRPLWRMARWELAWDWRIAMFGWHSFLFGLAIGAIASFLLVAHWHTSLFGG